MTAEEEIVTVIGCEELAMQLVTGSMFSYVHLKLKQDKDGIVMLQTAEHHPQRLNWKILLPLAKGFMRKRIVQDLTNLKQFVESH